MLHAYLIIMCLSKQTLTTSIHTNNSNINLVLHAGIYQVTSVSISILICLQAEMFIGGLENNILNRNKNMQVLTKSLNIFKSQKILVRLLKANMS